MNKLTQMAYIHMYSNKINNYNYCLIVKTKYIDAMYGNGFGWQHIIHNHVTSLINTLTKSTQTSLSIDFIKSEINYLLPQYVSNYGINIEDFNINQN